MTSIYLLVVLVTVVLVVGVDQSTKIGARAGLPLCSDAGTRECEGEAVLPGLKLTRVENGGTTATTSAGIPAASLVAVAGLAIGVAYAYSSRRAGTGRGLASGLLVGGAAGNLVDHVAFGGVTDFLAVAELYVINVADVALVTGFVGATAIAVASLGLLDEHVILRARILRTVGSGVASNGEGGK